MAVFDAASTLTGSSFAAVLVAIGVALLALLAAIVLLRLILRFFGFLLGKIFKKKPVETPQDPVLVEEPENNDDPNKIWKIIIATLSGIILVGIVRRIFEDDDD